MEEPKKLYDQAEGCFLSGVMAPVWGSGPLNLPRETNKVGGSPQKSRTGSYCCLNKRRTSRRNTFNRLDSFNEARALLSSAWSTSGTVSDTA